MGRMGGGFAKGVVLSLVWNFVLWMNPGIKSCRGSSRSSRHLASGAPQREPYQPPAASWRSPCILSPPHSDP